MPTSRDRLGYRAHKLLGAGACGEVWLAQDLNLPRDVAIKTLHLEADERSRADAIAFLRAEACLLAEVDHPNVVRVYRWLTVSDLHYLVMQHVPGGSLLDLLKREGTLDWKRAARYVADVGEGLLAIHASGIVHRDVKPANILWDPKRDEAVLTDLGIAARISDPASAGGTRPYMAPEAFEGRIAPSLDVYGLAATLFHLVAGLHRHSRGATIDALLRPQVLRRPVPTPTLRLPRRCPRSRLAHPDPPRPDARPRPSPPASVSSYRRASAASLNQLLADTLLLPPSGTLTPAPVELRLQVSRRIDADRYEPVAATHPLPDRLTRDMRRVPASPERVRLRTGDRVRVEVVADRAGYLAVFNVGPAGHLNLLYPDDLASRPPAPIESGRPLEILDVELTPPSGRERVFAVWSRQPLSLEPVAGAGRPRSRGVGPLPRHPRHEARASLDGHSRDSRPACRRRGGRACRVIPRRNWNG